RKGFLQGSFGTRIQASFERCVGGGDHRAAKAFLAVVEHHRLSRGDGALRCIEPYPQPAIIVDPDRTCLVRLPIPGLRGAAELARGRRSGHPVRRLRGQGGRLEPRRVMALVAVEDVVANVLPYPVRWFRPEASAADEVQAAG